MINILNYNLWHIFWLSLVYGNMILNGRSSSAFLSVVCQAFNDVPELCGETVSSENPSPGFGYATGSATTAQC